MKGSQHNAPGPSSYLAKDAVRDPHKKAVTVDIGLDQGKSHYSDEWRSTQPLLTDLDNVGLVPAFIVGDIHAAQLPDRCRVLGIPGTGSPELAAMKHAAHQARSPTPISILIKLALGKFGAAAGNIGLFADKGAAQFAGLQAFSEVLSTNFDETEGQALRDVRYIMQLGWKPQSQGHAQQGPLHRLQTQANEAVKVANSLLDKAINHEIAKCFSTLSVPLSRALEMVQRHPRVHLANLDLHSTAVANAVRASDAQCDDWPGDDTVSDAVKLGLLAYTLPGIHLDLPTTFGPFRFTPVLTNPHTAQMAWDCMTLAGRPRIQKQPLTDVIARVHSHNKALVQPQATNFKSALTSRFSRQSKYHASLEAAERTVPGSRWLVFEDLYCLLSPGYASPMDQALTSTVQNICHAITDIHRGPGVPEDWVDKMAFPVEVPVLPLGWQHDEVDRADVMARIQFDHAVASGNQEEAPQGIVSSNASPLPVGQGLVMIGDIGFEHYAEAAHFLDSRSAKLNIKIGFQNVAAIRGPFKRQAHKFLTTGAKLSDTSPPLQIPSALMYSRIP